MLTKLLPSDLHVSAMAVGTALGAAGSTGFPIAAGEIAYRKGHFPLLLLAVDFFSYRLLGLL